MEAVYFTYHGAVVVSMHGIWSGLGVRRQYSVYQSTMSQSPFSGYSRWTLDLVWQH